MPTGQFDRVSLSTACISSSTSAAPAQHPGGV